MNPTEEKGNWNEQTDKLKQKLALLFEEKISVYEKIIAEFKARISKEKKENIAKYEKTIAELEQKAGDMKKKLEDFKVEGKDKWDSFKLKFDHDMDELGKALKNFTVKSNDTAS
jgi:hypothetical protein